MRGRVWAYIGTLVGGVASLAANIAHCYVPPPGAPVGWSPEVGAVVSAMFWPLALFIAVEILVRTPWPTGRWWLLARFAGLLPVALVAAVVSYRHLSALLTHYGEDALTSIAGPAAVDGLMVMAAAALLASSTQRHHVPAREPAGESASAGGAEAARESLPLHESATRAVPVPDGPAAPAAAPAVSIGRTGGGAIGSGVVR